MSGDHCDREETQRNFDGGAEQQELVASSAPSKSRSRDSGSRASAKNRDASVNQNGVVEKDGVSSVPKKGVKLSKNELLDAAEFNKTIGTWFGEKGFVAMRSFFRASVLNSLQKDPIGLNQTNCTDLDAVIVTLIADYLVKNGKYFTMSVFSNEVLRPLVSSYPNLNQVLQRIGKYEGLGEPTLTQETVSFVLRTLDVQTHSMLGAGILHKYLEARSGDLLSVVMGLLRDNAPILNVKERAVRDDDVVAAFSEGLQEEMGKLHCWFSNFNNQFVDVSGRLRKLIHSQTLEDGVKPQNFHWEQDEQELWNQMVRMDEHLKKQQECLMKMRDQERKKLAAYAKELEDLHQEMNMKLKSIQDYEKTLKMREKALKQSEAIGSASVEYCGRGDHKMLDFTVKRKCWAGTDARDTLAQRSDTLMINEAKQKPTCTEMTGQIMQENLELRATLREQNSRIEALTRKAALLSAGCYKEEPMASRLSYVRYGRTPVTDSVRHNRDELVTSRDPAYQREVLPSKPPHSLSFHKPFSPGRSLVSAMSSALRTARMEIDNLRNEQNTTDLQYDRLLHNKLSKRL